MTMSNALAPSVHIDVPMTNMSWALLMRDAPVALSAQPTLTVPKMSDIFPLYDPKELFRNTAQVLDFNTQQTFSGYALGTDQYKVDLEYVEEILLFKDLQNMDSVLSLERFLAYSAATKLKINMEDKFATVLFDKDNWKASSTYKIGRAYRATNPHMNHHFVDFGVDAADAARKGANQYPFGRVNQNLSNGFAASNDNWGRSNDIRALGFWDDPGTNGSSIVDDVQSILAVTETESGFTPDTAIMTPATYRAIAINENLREYYKYTNSGIPPASTFAEWMGIEKIMLSRTLENKDRMGFRAQRVIPDGDVLFVKTMDSVGLMMPACYQIFVWDGYFSDAIAGFRSATSTVGIRRIRDEIREAYIIRAYMPVEVKMIANIMGFYVRNAVRNTKGS